MINNKLKSPLRVEWKGVCSDCRAEHSMVSREAERDNYSRSFKAVCMNCENKDVEMVAK